MEVLMSNQAPTPLTEKEALQTLGAYYAKQSHYLEALKVYTRLDKIAPRQEDILINLASASSYNGDMPKALLALNQGVIAQPAYVALVLMALLTTIITPLVLRNLLLK